MSLSSPSSPTAPEQLPGRVFFSVPSGFLWWFLPVLLIASLIRFHNLTEILVGGRLYFVDADCYSRMSRAQLVSASPGTVIHRQMFENWPEGVASHATAPMDYAIVGLERALRWTWPRTGRLAILRESTLDLAGALISPLLGIGLCAFLALWAYGIRLSDGTRPALWWAVPVLAAVSPPLVHATVFGRPDHQSLLIFLLASALGGEQRLQQGAGRAWAWAGGLAWGLALWVSLYEPLVLLGASLGLAMWFWRAGWQWRIRGHWALALGLVLTLAWFVDGIRIVTPDAIWAEALRRWGATIGELQSVDGLTAVTQWTGLLLWGLPVLLLWHAHRIRSGRAVAGWLILLLVSLALTFWQIRWSPYCVLIFACCLPWALSVLPGWKRNAALWILSLWPLVQEWELRWFPEASLIEQRYLDRSERINARSTAERMRSSYCEPFLAVWWLSPSLAYWSGQPAVAGSGHEGISGIVDTARFFMSTDPTEAREILVRRGVRIVVASDSARAVENSTAILARTPAGKALAERLWQPDPGAAWKLEGEGNVTTFRLLRVLE